MPSRFLSRRRRRRSDSRLRKLHHQPLEERTLLSVTADYHDGLLIVSSDANDDIVLGSRNGLAKINDRDTSLGELSAGNVTRVRVVGRADSRTVDLSAFTRAAFHSVEEVTFVGVPWVDPAKVEQIADETLGLGWAAKIGIVDTREFLLSGNWRQPLADGSLAERLTQAGWGNAQGLLDSIVTRAGRTAVVDSLSFATANKLDIDVLFNGRLEPRNISPGEEVLISEDSGLSVDSSVSSSGSDFPPMGLSGESDIHVVSVSDATVAEPPPGSEEPAAMVFQVYFEDDFTGGGVSFQYQTSDGPDVGGAKSADGDYEPISSPATTFFSSGESAVYVTVWINSDSDYSEGDETFLVEISNVTGNAELGESLGLGTILDSPPPPTIDVLDATIYEPEDPTETAEIVFTVNLSEAATWPVTFEWSTQSIGEAESPADYEAVSQAGPVTIDPGLTSTTVTVLVKGDVLDELDEAFEVHLSAIAGADEGDVEAVGTILDTDTDLSISNAAVFEPDDAGDPLAQMVFTVSLSTANSVPVTFRWQTQAMPGQADADDYVEQALSDPVTIAPTETVALISVPVKWDNVFELSETFEVNLSDLTYANAIDDTGVGTIIDSNGAPRLSIGSVTVDEDDPNEEVVLTVTVSHPSSQVITVDWDTVEAFAEHVDVGVGDFDLASGTVTFQPGEISQPIAIAIHDDDEPEIDEWFAMLLSNPSAYSELEVAEAVITIIDDDPATLTIAPQQFTIPENSKFGDEVGTIAWAEDLRPTQLPGTITVQAGNGESVFDVDGSTGKITVAEGAVLDYETSPSSYDLQVRVGTPGADDEFALMTITVDNEDEAPYFTGVTNGLNPMEGEVPSQQYIGWVGAEDPDIDGTDGWSFEILSGDGDNQFILVPNPYAPDYGVHIYQTLGAELDFETRPTYELTLKVTDADDQSLFDTTVVTINVQNINEPPEISPQTLRIAENVPRHSVVGTVAGYVDPGETRTFTITTPNVPFDIDPDTGRVTVNDPAALDYEVVPLHQYVFDVALFDGGTSESAQITIEIEPVNDAPALNDHSFSVSEDAPFDYTVGTLQATDQDDPADALRFAITTGNEEGIFAIEPNGIAGQADVVVAKPQLLDFERTSQHVFYVQVTDDGDGTLSGTGKVTVTVGPANEAPTIATFSFTIPEDVPNGGQLGYVKGFDPDGDSLLYSIPVSSAFDIDSTSGKITIADTTQVTETAPGSPITFTVEVSDEQASPVSGQVEVHVIEAGMSRTINIGTTVRDFKDDHSDFQGTFPPGHSFAEITEGLVRDDLGADRKPRLSDSHPYIESESSFAQWYNDVDGINIPISQTIQFTELNSST